LFFFFFLIVFVLVKLVMINQAHQSSPR
jgi:hypothetical protein